MKMTNICLNCNSEFDTEFSFQKYCSKKCRQMKSYERWAGSGKKHNDDKFDGSCDFYKHFSASPPNDKDVPLRNVKSKIGLTFNDLTVVDYAPPRLKKSKRSDSGRDRWVTYWTVKCACGNIREVKDEHLTSGKTKSCGCLRIRVLANPDPIGQYYKSWLMDVPKKRPGMEISISRNEFEELILGDCVYCGGSPDLVLRNSRGIIRNTIDRKDSSVGYVKDNCVSCCWTCNKMKRTMGYDDFLQHVKKICDHKLHTNNNKLYE